jgi:hypothetical protein
MKFAFIIDKTQTFQIIAKLLKSSLEKDHDCDVYCCFDIAQLDYLGSYYKGHKDRINWISNKNRNFIVKELFKKPVCNEIMTKFYLDGKFIK